MELNLSLTCSLPYSQEPTTELHPEAGETSPVRCDTFWSLYPHIPLAM
jgi:hypothetical protein